MDALAPLAYMNCPRLSLALHALATLFCNGHAIALRRYSTQSPETVKECILLSLMCAMVGSVAGAQSSPPVTQCIGSASLVFSDSVSFFLDAPSGWVLDCKAGKRDGVMTVLYRTGESWRTGQAVMYANVLTPKGSTVEGFDARVRNEVASWSAGVPDAKVTVGRRIPTKAGQSAIVRKFTSASKDLFEIVAYVPRGRVIPILAMTARSGTAFTHALPAFERLVRSYAPGPSVQGR